MHALALARVPLHDCLWSKLGNSFLEFESGGRNSTGDIPLEFERGGRNSTGDILQIPPQHSNIEGEEQPMRTMRVLMHEASYT